MSKSKEKKLNQTLKAIATILLFIVLMLLSDGCSTNPVESESEHIVCSSAWLVENKTENIVGHWALDNADSIFFNYDKQEDGFWSYPDIVAEILWVESEKCLVIDGEFIYPADFNSYAVKR